MISGFISVVRGRLLILCFAHDLMIFCRAKVGLVSLVRNCLNEFRVAFGLSPNLDKSSMLCDVEPNTKLQLLDAFGYKEGKLYIRYLGVPFITTKLLMIV
jgi:hypothetical protein